MAVMHFHNHDKDAECPYKQNDWCKGHEIKGINPIQKNINLSPETLRYYKHRLYYIKKQWYGHYELEGEWSDVFYEFVDGSGMY
ncbi:MAG: hypothetical protein MSA84_06150 [Lachnospiraceae bacterium]|nr:hypothetical protein [Lachnospiraceae bacterium]